MIKEDRPGTQLGSTDYWYLYSTKSYLQYLYITTDNAVK